MADMEEVHANHGMQPEKVVGFSWKINWKLVKTILETEASFPILVVFF